MSHSEAMHVKVAIFYGWVATIVTRIQWFFNRKNFVQYIYYVSVPLTFATVTRFMT